MLTRVGAHPRALLRVSFARAAQRAKLGELTAKLPPALAKCGIDPRRLGELQIAIGEPLRVAAELDGPVDARALACAIGARDMQTLTALGVVVRDRPGGVTVEYQPEAAAAPVGQALARRCTGIVCLAATFGPASRPLELDAHIDKTFQFELGGPALGHGAAAAVAAIDQIRPDNPSLRALAVRDQHGTLAAELATTDVVQAMTIALVIRKNLLEAFQIPTSSMVPTLHVDDNVFAAKGPLAGAPAPGDVVLQSINGTAHIRRYLANAGQLVREVADDFTIDGKPLPTEIVQRDYHYSDRDLDTHAWQERTGTLVREHLGARSYLTLRLGPPDSGVWPVPAGELFLVGDNRNNVNDSRFRDATPASGVIGRVLTVSFAYHNGVIDWDRMGVPLD